MEYLPRRTWDDNLKEMRWHGPQRGRARRIQPGSVLHISVLERMKKLGYSPDNVPRDYNVVS